MSGIAGILNLDGTPADGRLLRAMADYLAFRGPDARETWAGGPVGFAHTLLRTTWESEHERQPCSLDGRVWITADARIDYREELIERLQRAGQRILSDVTDPQLILHAYHVWDEGCLEYLLGDFCFAIWDGGRRRLFCARDHLGIKLFYYSQSGRSYTFSNTLRCVRLNGAVSSELNDSAVVDFLLTGNNQNPRTTTFRDIQRLPPGHSLTISPEGARVSCYWTLPVEGPLFYNRPEDYREHFRSLLRDAVRNRLRSDRVGVFMSGGLDSTALAATARELLAARSSSYDLRAYTVVYDCLLPDDERRYADLAAAALRIPIHFLVGDDYGLYEAQDQPGMQTPEPAHNPMGALAREQFKQISLHSRIAYYGEGPDNALYYEWQPYVFQMLKTLQWATLLRDFWWHGRFHRVLPVVTTLGDHLSRRWKRREAAPPELPWIRPEMLKLATPAESNNSEHHPYHPISHSWLTGPAWGSIFQTYDPGSTMQPVEVSHPYLDLRLVRYLLSIPRIPWCRDKYLMRSSMQGKLPPDILQRPKTPLKGSLAVEQIKRQNLPMWAPERLICKYIEPAVVDAMLQIRSPYLDECLRTFSLNYFLASFTSFG